MRRVELPGTPITTSRLGFGCARLLGPVSRAEATRILETALDAGVTHFDVARAYGSGEAEAVLGAFAASRRDRITITTKFGIAPSGSVARHPRLRNAARRAMRVSPGVRRALGRQSARMSVRGQFDPAAVRASVQTSLSTLGLAHVDVLLAHDATAADCTPELLDVLDALRTAGTIRAYGVGSHVAHVEDVVADAPAFAGVLQFAASGLDDVAATIGAHSGGAVSTFGALGALAPLRAALRADPALASRWRRDLDVDPLADDVLAELLLAGAVDANDCGPTLFSTVRAERVAANAAAVARTLSEPDRLGRFRDLARDVLG